MFKKLLRCILFFPIVAFAQPITVERPMYCHSTNLVMAELARSEYKEIPIWMGNSDNNTKVLLILNSKTKTWTLLIFNEEIACLFAAGDTYRFFEANL